MPPPTPLIALFRFSVVALSSGQAMSTRLCAQKKNSSLSAGAPTAVPLMTQPTQCYIHANTRPVLPTSPLPTQPVNALLCKSAAQRWLPCLPPVSTLQCDFPCRHFVSTSALTACGSCCAAGPCMLTASGTACLFNMPRAPKSRSQDWGRSSM